MYRWHGPGVVCATEPPANLDLSLLDRCYWVVHGSALIRCTHEQLRPETVDERDNRERLTETHMPAPNLDTIRGLLSKVKGPVRFVDLTGKKRPYGHAPASIIKRLHRDWSCLRTLLLRMRLHRDRQFLKTFLERRKRHQDSPVRRMTRWARVSLIGLHPFEPEETDADGDPIGKGPEAGKGEDPIGTS